MELKVACECGQKYKFDVEPVDGRMPFTVNCPICGVDGTPAANQLLSQQFASVPAAPTVAMAAPVSSAASGLRINRPTPAAAPPPLPAGSPTPPPLPRSGPAPIVPIIKSPVGASKSKDFNMGLGILGAFLGAAVGGGLMFAFFEWADFRFPWTGTITGALAGFGARTLARGTDNTLGFIAGGIALVCIISVFFLMYGELSVSAMISAAVCVYFAYRIASG